MSCIDKLAWTVLISTACVPVKQGRFYLFFSLMSFFFLEWRLKAVTYPATLLANSTISSFVLGPL